MRTIKSFNEYNESLATTLGAIALATSSINGTSNGNVVNNVENTVESNLDDVLDYLDTLENQNPNVFISDKSNGDIDTSRTLHYNMLIANIDKYNANYRKYIYMSYLDLLNKNENKPFKVNYYYVSTIASNGSQVLIPILNMSIERALKIYNYDVYFNFTKFGSGDNQTKYFGAKINF